MGTKRNHKAVINLNSKEDDTTSKIDAIKNLIFGDNIQAYDSEFELIKQDILDKKKVLEDLIEEVGSDLKTALDNVSTDVNIRITELEENLESKIDKIDSTTVNKKMLGDLLIQLGEKVADTK